MALSDIGVLMEKRRYALLEYSIGQVNKPAFDFVKSAADLFELLRTDPLDTFAVQNSWVAEATSCVQQYIHAVYRKLEPGFATHQFPPHELAQWQLYNNYPDWAAVQLISIYPENYINPFVRQRKSSLFKNLENDLNQSRLNNDSVQSALQGYLHTFEQTCDLDVLSCYMDGATPDLADYYFVGRQRVQPFQYYWRKAGIELTPTCVGVNPAAWSEWQAVDIQPANRVLDMRPVFWNGRLCLVWAQWRDKVSGKDPKEFIPARLEVHLAFMTQSGQWSAPLDIYSADFDTAAEPVNFRLIASVLMESPASKGKLGILITADQTPDDLRVQKIFDVLMRPDTIDAGTWLDAARERFATAETVQHSLSNQVTMTSAGNPEGSMSPFLSLQATAVRLGGRDVVTVIGLCEPTGLPDAPQSLPFAMGLVNKTVDDRELNVDLSPVGGWTTEPLTLSRSKGSWPQPTAFKLVTQTAGFGGREFKLTIANLSDFTPPTLLKNSTDAAQFLSFNLPAPYLRHTRLNSLFGPELVQLSNIGVDAVLDWSTQFKTEPPPAADPAFKEINGAFDGANGLFFWELFFHLPHLVATLLRNEERFADSQNWLHYVFDPQAAADESDINGKPLYWRCRPLAKNQGNPGCEALAPIDPDAIGYSKPEHFKIRIFCDYVINLMEQGNGLYRQLTRDSLVAAKLCYVQAGFLMGKAPTALTVSRWQTKTVGELLEECKSRPELEAFEQTLNFSLADVPSGSDAAPMLGMLACGPFKAPINQPLLDLFAAPEQRLHNLRNNLTIDGKPLDIPLFSPPTDPNQLLRDLAAGGAAGPRSMGGTLVVNAFHWRLSHEVALRSSQVLEELGSKVLSMLQLRDNAEQEVLQQTHLVELGDYAKTVQEQSIAQLEASVTALEQSRAVALQRAETYAQHYDQNVSAVEYEVLSSLYLSKMLSLASSSIQPAAAALAALPNILGLANGGHRVDRALEAVSFGLGVASSVAQLDADKQATTEAYRRRRDDWQLQRDQALLEVDAIDAQIEAQRHAVTAARTSLAQTLRANGQALTIYNYLKKRATNAELFGWMLGQLKALHYQAYDAVISLCLTAQNSMNAETGDYDKQIPMPKVWLDQRHGFTAGEHLRGYLLQMEREYLQRFERRLELTKTVSLRKLFDDTVDPQKSASDWADALKQLRRTGSLEFSLPQLLYDRDYPGHFCRQISSVEVNLPVLLGPYEDVKATLVQFSSMTATRATTQSVQYLHNPQGVAPSDVLFNLRSGQQIALSSGIADNGMTAMKPDEGLLNPFENTGAVSKWKLSFPWPSKSPQSDVMGTLTDIILVINFRAKSGDATFVSKVMDLVTAIEKPEPDKLGKGARNHG
ncbi:MULTISPECIES: neuraminidase-like domain-containing protein [Pseudomonas]|uniref:Tc toxin subunit A-related protein n=1 Tax=Pseudomonas TaxID=286 RepID=UPI001B32176E|nr:MULTISPECIES: neuraminidase-like domain-containing protein [Pseudomonas]MBP5945795.1 insecticidal toxin complex protein TcaB2 [Pseudomonas sp. P9(2020)]MBP5955365.1 insecticidal toxin complex protein TcaB2 [Pseudomonas anatoliensis]MBZ9563331.1 insecticidal toxin complex protein TcaB2 [Pseudomonas sp. P116]